MEYVNTDTNVTTMHAMLCGKKSFTGGGLKVQMWHRVVQSPRPTQSTLSQKLC